MISVRISEEEYAALRLLCSMTGARSVSDLTRHAMRDHLNGRQKDVSPIHYMNEFQLEMKDLSQKIAQLTEEISMLKNGTRH